MKLEKPLRLVWLNRGNNTGHLQVAVIEKLHDNFPGEKIVALEVGSPYGGAVEMMAKALGKNSIVYGYDTFVGHPRDLADDPNSMEATCMEPWYSDDHFGRAGLDYDYQRKILDEEGLDNAILVKGRINEHSFDDIEKAHFVMIDLDLIKPTRVAYYAIKDKIVKGGYLFMHDAYPPEHLPFIYEFVHNEIMSEGIWDLIEDNRPGVVTVLKRK